MSEARTIVIEMDTRQANAELDRLHRKMNTVGNGQFTGLSGQIAALQRQLSGVQGASAGAATGVTGLGSASSRAGSSLAAMRGTAMGAVAGVTALTAAVLAGISVFSKFSDAAGLMDAKLRLAVQGWGSVAVASADVQRIAAETRGELTSTAVLYGKLAGAGKNLNASQTQVARGTESVTKALKVSGAGAAETEAAVLQLGQALSSGKLGGDEFSSLMETSPRLMQLFADSMNKPVGSLKKLAGEGKLTADVLFRALTDPKFTEKLDEEFRQLPKTFDDAFTSIKNTATSVMGAFNDGGQFSQSFYEFATTGNKNLESIMQTARDVGSDIRITFTSLNAALFQPLLDGARSVFSQIGGLLAGLGIQVFSVQRQIVSVLSSIDRVRNAPKEFQDFIEGGNAKFRKATGFKSKQPQRSNLAGDYVREQVNNIGMDRRNTERARLIGNIQARDAKYDTRNKSDKELIAHAATLKGKPVLSGGTGQLRAPKLDTDDKKKNKGKTDAEREAEREAKRLANIKTRYDEFFTSLTEQAKVAAMLPGEAEKYNKELEVRKILGDGELSKARELTQIEKNRIKTAIDGKNLAEINRSLTEATRSVALDTANLEERARLSQTLKGEALDAELGIQTKLQGYKSKMLADGLKLEDASYQTNVRLYENELRRNAAIERRIALEQRGVDLVKDGIQTNGTIDQRRAAAQTRFTDDKKALDAGLKAGRYSAEEFKTGVKAAAERLKDDFREIGTEFAQKMNNVADAFHSIGDRLGGKLGELFNGAGDISSSIGDFTRNQDEVGGKITKLFKDPNSGLARGIGNAVGGAMAGYEIGSSIGGIGKTLGIKGFNKGAKIGGTIGGLTGNPAIAAAASVVGGTIGAIFHKTKQGSAGFKVDASGKVVGMKATGSGSKEKAVATEFAANVANSLNSLASSLGATIGNVSGVSVGYRPGHKAGAYRVDPTGAGKLKNGSVAAFDNEADALKFAIKDAIKDGALMGLSEFASKAVNSLDIDAAVSLVQSFNSVMDDLGSITDPLGTAVRGLNKNLDSLVKQMTSVGASSTDLAKVEQYRKLKLEEISKAELSGYKELLSTLKGDGSGVSALSQLTAKMTEFDTYKSDISAGKSIDQSAFTALGQDIFARAGDLYGTSTKAFQDIRADLTSTTNAALSNAQKVVDNATALLNATTANTQEVTDRIDTTNDLIADQTGVLEEIRAAIASGGLGGVFRGYSNDRLANLA